jgi:hypothetical protein
MQIPNLLRDLKPNLKGVKDAYLKLNKLLYGLKQALREWFYIVKKFFKNIGLKSAKANPNLFIGNKRNSLNLSLIGISRSSLASLTSIGDLSRTT